MDVREISKLEYKSRINKVMDYIDAHLDQPIDLNVLAEVAMFSPYHFHRIFAVIQGETPNNYLFRIRIEKAAQLLNDSDNYPVSEIAARCGFNSLSSFSRAFRKYFDMTTKEFRMREKMIYIKDGIRYSKNGKTLSKIDQNGNEVVAELCPVELQKLIIMGTKIEIKEMPELKVIYCRHMGAFAEIDKAYEKLMKWAGPRGLLRFPETKSLTIYQDDPNVTSIDKVRQDACITVTEDVKVEGEIGKAVVAGGKYAVGRFEIGVMEFEKAWNTMCSWLTESGYEPADASCYELYHNNQMEHPERKFILDICIPVKQL